MKFFQALEDMNADLYHIKWIHSHVTLSKENVLEAQVKFAHHNKMRAFLNL